MTRFGAGCVLVVVLGGGIPTAAVGADPVAPAESGPPPSKGDGRRTLGRLPANLGRSLIGVFDKDNLMPFVVGGAATGVAAIFDQDLRSSVSSPESGFGTSLETAGAWPASVVAVGLFTAGRLAHEQRFRAMSYDLIGAALVNAGYTELLKVTVRRERPDGSNNKSFPSGHASNAFTMATVAERHYGWKVGVPAYALAAAIGYSRMVRDKHYLSDVVAGATVGYVVGRTVVRVNDRALEPNGAATSFNLRPILTREARGLEMSVTF